MAKIIKLSEEECSVLRELILSRFGKDLPKSRIKINSYKPNYKPLLDQMASREYIDNHSLGLTRLVKLFYFSDPRKCPPGQFENPNFGSDFLDACYLYSTEGKHNRRNYLKQATDTSSPVLKRKHLIFVMVVVLPAVAFFLLTSSGADAGFTERFDFDHVAELADNGWQIIDADSNLATDQHYPGYLILRTKNGDYWTKDGETPYISNLLVKKIPQMDCFEIVLKVDNFDPTEDWQQFALFLLDKDRNRTTNWRFGFAYASSPNRFTNKLGTKSFKVVELQAGEATEHYSGVIEGLPPYVWQEVPDELWMKVTSNGSSFDLLYRGGADHTPYFPLKSFDSTFEPEYIGLAAFCGITDLDGNPQIAEEIEVYMDELSISPCP